MVVTSTIQPMAVRPTSGTAAESVTLTIADTNDVNSYHIIITHDTVTVYNDVVDSKVFTLEEGLTANTAYNVSVAAVCPDGNETAKVYTSFRTECALMTLPYTENFESVASYSFPECWTLLKKYTSYGSTYPYVSSTTDAPDGAKAIYMYTSASSDTNMFRTSVIPLEPNQIHISFWSSCRNLKVGLMTESNDPSSFVPLMTTNSDSWTEYDIFTDTLDLEAENVYLAFLLTGGNRYGYVDGILIEQSSDCRRPVSGRLVSKSYNNAVVGINADEGYFPSGDKGAYGPYKQSERRMIYKTVIKELIRRGRAYLHHRPELLPREQPHRRQHQLHLRPHQLAVCRRRSRHRGVGRAPDPARYRRDPLLDHDR